MMPVDNNIPQRPKSVEKNQPMENPEDLIRCCQHCRRTFNFDERSPRFLPCGNTLCLECIFDGLKSHVLPCPLCKEEHLAKSHTDFPTNQQLESIIKKFVSQPATAPAGSISISEEMKSKRRDLGKDMQGVRVTSQELSSELHQYHSIMKTWKKQHSAIIHQHKEIIHDIDKECVRVTDTIEDNEEDRQKLKAADDKLFAVNTEPDFVLAAEQAQLCHNVIENWIYLAQQDFPKSELVEKSAKLRAATQVPSAGDKTASGDSQSQCQQSSSSSHKSVEDGSSSSDTQHPCCLLADVERLVRTSSACKDIQEKGVQTEDDEPQTLNLGPNVETKDALALFIREIEVLNVYAIKDVGRDLYAKLSLREDHLCLSAFSDETPPSHCRITKYDNLILIRPNDTKLVFLEFQFDDRFVAEIFIRLTSNTKRAQNFLLLCTGELGKSFLNTSIRQVWRKGCPGEFVQCGADGMSLVRGAGEEEGGVLERTDQEGSVIGYPGDEMGCLFSITTIDNKSDSCSTVFGHVVSGLDCLKKAVLNFPDIKNVTEDESFIYSRDIKDVKVTDCGVVLAENLRNIKI